MTTQLTNADRAQAVLGTRSLLQLAAEALLQGESGNASELLASALEELEQLNEELSR
jgi:hypothetical protein